MSRRDIDPDALRVLCRLRDANFVAYLVGGSVRDLLLGLRPKDFDIGTSAHPYQIKRLFRNCWIIGRRFRLAHVKFGQKVIEVATFRRQVTTTETVAEEPGPSGVPEPEVIGAAEPAAQPRDLLIHRDNTFGTPEQDAFRRDFTVNALFYDIATFSIIDYVGGLGDLRRRVVRSIGNPEERFREDPVRMLRAVALAERLDFGIDPPVLDAIRRHHQDIGRSAPARVLEEYYKILRSGRAERVFRRLAAVGLLDAMTPELNRAEDDRLWESLAALDTYRQRFGALPDTLTNAVLLGSLIVPLGFGPRSAPVTPGDDPKPWLGRLPAARRDLDHLRHLLMLQRRLTDAMPSPRAIRALMARSAFNEAVTWLEVHGQTPELVQRWRSLQEEPAAQGEDRRVPLARRRRRRRRYRAAEQG